MVITALSEISNQMMVMLCAPIISSSLLAATAMGMVRLPSWLMGVTNKNAPIMDGIRNLQNRLSFNTFITNLQHIFIVSVNKRQQIYSIGFSAANQV